MVKNIRDTHERSAEMIKMAILRLMKLLKLGDAQGIDN